MTILFTEPSFVPVSGNSVVYPGAKLYFYETGTSTLQNVYTDSALSVAHANPVVADADGRFAPIYLDPTLLDYKIVLKDSSDVTIWTVDPYSATSIATTLASSVSNISALLAVDGATTTKVFANGYHTAGDGGGGEFYWDASQNKANHNGGTIIDPDVTFPSDWTNQTQVTTWFTAGTGTGCWVRVYVGDVNPKMFGAKGDGVTNDSLAIQKTLDTYAAVFLPAGTYAVSALTMDNGINRSLYGEGSSSILYRKSNGPVITISSSYNTLVNIIVSSDGVLTGDNIVLDNTDHSYLYNVVSQQAVGHALKASGTYNSLKIIGGRYTLSNNAPALHPPIELGDSSNTANSLYANIQGITFNENDAPLVLYAGQTCFITDCQIGGLQLLEGSGAALGGVTNVISCRITGDVQISGSGNTVIGCGMSSSSDVEFLVGSNSCYWFGNTEPNSLVNNGNTNNMIFQTDSGYLMSNNGFTSKNNKGIRLRNAADTATIAEILTTTADYLSITNTENNKGVIIGATGTGGTLQIVNLPTSSAGLPAQTLWNDAGTLKIT